MALGPPTIAPLACLVVLCLLVCPAPAQDAAPPPGEGRADPLLIALAGDSTVRTSASGKTGWGQVLDEAIAALQPGLNVRIDNHARGGRSSRSFIQEGRWQALLDTRPDVVLIQFGHNDLLSKPEAQRTSPAPPPQVLPVRGFGSQPTHWYRLNLAHFVRDVRSIDAQPVIVMPMERLLIDEDSNSSDKPGPAVQRINKPYADAARDVAQRLGVPVIDLHAFSLGLYEHQPQSQSLKLHATGEDGQPDRSHFNRDGARRYADRVARDLLRLLQPSLAAAPDPEDHP